MGPQQNKGKGSDKRDRIKERQICSERERERERERDDTNINWPV